MRAVIEERESVEVVQTKKTEKKELTCQLRQDVKQFTVGIHVLRRTQNLVISNVVFLQRTTENM